jgi:hypothetical protein
MNKLPQKEKDLHRSVCEYIKLQYPKTLFNSDMSGIKLTMGQAVQAKKLRSNQGFPDIVIYEKRGNYSACFIELKREGEKLYKKDGSFVSDHIKEQHDCIIKLISRGYMACFAIGFDNAKGIIDAYLHGVITIDANNTVFLDKC